MTITHYLSICKYIKSYTSISTSLEWGF